MKYSSHKSYYNTEGTEIPSVTTILSIINKPQLVKWANIMGFKRKDTDAILERAGTIGTITHDFIEHLIKQETFEYPEEHLRYMYDVEKKCISFSDWYTPLKEYITHEFMEKSFSSTDYGGTVDFYGTLRGRKVILDFKTSNKLHTTFLVQLAAYIQLLEENNHVVEAVGIVHVKDNNTTLHMIERKDMDEYIEIFNKIKEVFIPVYDIQNRKIRWSELKC